MTTTTNLPDLTEVQRKIASGDISFNDLLKAVAPAPAPLSAPETIPVPTTVSDSQKAALEKLSQVYGSVVPTERRILAPVEVESLIDERLTLDEIENMAKERKESIRTTVANHLDMVAEDEGVPQDTERDQRGHYILAGKAPGVGSAGKQFSREVRSGSASLSMQDLEALADDESVEGFTRQDFLDMTTQVRVFDEAKAVMLLRKRPELVEFVAQATQPVRPTTSLYLRKA